VDIKVTQHDSPQDFRRALRELSADGWRPRDLDRQHRPSQGIPVDPLAVTWTRKSAR
jgi:hypothetical protein